MLRRSGRVSKILVAVLVALVVIGAVGLAILPEIVRRVAVSQAAKITGRDLSLEDVDLNLFTGHLALKGFKLAQRNSKESALEFERLDVRLGYLPLLRGNARVTELALVAPTIRVTRTGPEEFDFSDLLARRGSEDSSRAPSQRTSPSKWTVTLDRPSVRRLTFVARDLTTSPASEWRISELTVDASDLTTRVAARSGRVETKLKLKELTLRIQRLQRDRGLADFGAAVAVEFKERLPGMTPPKSGEEQLALLREREPAPESRLSELQTRRLEVVRQALTKAEGIPADRLLASEAKASDDATEGRIEFQLEQ